MTIPSLPPGFRFHPTDIELVKFYLTRKVLGKSFPVEAIAEVDIYKDAPWDLPSKACMRSKDLKWYFFCPRERKYSTGARTNRSTGFGCWKTTGNDRPVIYKGKTVGMRKSLVFHLQGEGAKKDRTDWVMHEYRLEDEDLKTKGVAQDAFVLCMIYEKDGLGPKNGAQYGAPFNEEEWDEDGEADVPSASGFTEEFILPDKRKHAVDIRIPDPKRFCLGSTSKACPAGPSQIVPSVVNVRPPAPPNDVTMEDCQNEYQYHHSCGIFGDDIPPASVGNDKVENLDHIYPDGNHKPEVTMDDIFDGLGDLGDSSAPYHHDNNFGVDASMLPPSGTFMELKDLDAPLTSVDGPGPSGHNYSERYHSAFDHSVAAQSFLTPVISDDENAPGLWLKDLDSPLACGDALFSHLGGNEGLGGSVNIPNPLVCAQPFQNSEVTHVAENFPWSSRYPQLEPVEGHVHMLQEEYRAEECTNLETVRNGVGAATSFINNPNLRRTHACENLGRGEETIFCSMLQFLEHPRHPSSAVERPAPFSGAKRSDGHALFLLHGDSSFHVKAEVTLGEGGHGCTNDALSRGLEGFPFVTDCEENGSGSRNVAANCGCGILLSLVLLTLSGFYAFLAVRTSVIGDFHETFKLLFLDVVWLIDQIYVWCAFIELSLSSASPFALYAISFPFGIRSFEAPDITSSLLGTLISLVPEAVGSCLLLGLQLTHQCECADFETMNYLKTPREFLWPIDLVF